MYPQSMVGVRYFCKFLIIGHLSSIARPSILFDIQLHAYPPRIATNFRTVQNIPSTGEYVAQRHFAT